MAPTFKGNPKDAIYKKLGNIIKDKREKLNISQKDLATKLKTTGQVINKLEKGDSLPTLPDLIDIAKALSTSVSELLSDF
jgi:transcriptional regulator with XRE-family HTH domain